MTGVTMKSVAELARCDPSTVSLALRNDPRIPRTTRDRVRAAAEKLGYRVNPLIAAWVAARRASVSTKRFVTVAYLSCHPAGIAWKEDIHFGSIYTGAKERLEENGFALSAIELSNYRTNRNSLNQVLVTRNVQGLIIGPTTEHHTLDGLEWDRFALVTIGYGLTAPRLHRVTEDHHLGMNLAFETCLRGGHRRIGLAITGRHHSTRRELWVSAYLGEQRARLNRKECIPIFEHENADRSLRAKWLARYRPDCILADDIGRWAGSTVPVFGIAISTPDPLTGVHENNLEIGRHAGNLLISLIFRNERGIPPVRQTVLVEPYVRDKETRPA